MSTKTSIKRIALVAVSALAFGFTSNIPASASVATGDYGVCTAYVSSATACTQVAGGQATVEFTAGTSYAKYLFSVTGGNFVGETVTDAGTAVTITYTNGQNAANGFTVEASGATFVGDEVLTFKVTSAAAGSMTVSATPLTALGVPGTARNFTVTWVASSTIGLSAATTSINLINDDANCVYNASQSVQDAAIAAKARSSMSYADTTGARELQLCIIPRDGNGNVIEPNDLTTVIVSLTGGSLGAGAITRVATKAAMLDNVGGAIAGGVEEGLFQLFGDGLAEGAQTLSVTLIKGSAVVTKSLTVTYYSEVTEVSLTQVTGSGNPGSVSSSWAANDYTDATDKDGTAVVFAIVCKDGNGSTVANCDNDGDGAGSDTVYVVTDSDKTPGAPAFSAALPVNNTDAVGVTTTAALGSGTASVVNLFTSYVVVDGDAATTATQKLSITVCLPNLLKSGTPADVCASGTYYLAGGTSAITVVPASTSVAAGASTTVNVSVTDASGYPVADSTSVTLAATNGSVVAPSSKTTFAGAFATPAAFVAGSGASASMVTAIIGSRTGSATINITGTSDTSTSDAINAAADAAAEAIDAANAATDAANLAAEAADAATVAAEEARDAADAATAAVEALATEVATLMAALKAQITTLANTVAKIAKKVKA